MTDDAPEQGSETVRFVVDDDAVGIRGQQPEAWLRSDSVVVLADWR
jgi:hypothetical protein